MPCFMFFANIFIKIAKKLAFNLVKPFFLCYNLYTMEEVLWSKNNNKQVQLKDYVVATKDKELADKVLSFSDYYEMILVNSGNAVFVIEGRSNYITKGDVILLSPNEIHNFGDSISEDFTYDVISFSGKYLNSLSTPNTDLSIAFKKASSLHKNIVKADEGYCKRFSTLFQLIKGVNKLSYGGDVLARVHTSTFLVSLNRLALEYIDDSEEECTLIDKIIIYIEQNLDKDLSIDNISKEFALSPFRLSHFFKEQTMLTVHQFVLQKRLAFSKNYILLGVSVKDTAKLCGFNDVSNYFRAFKVAFNITPKDYYKMMKE